MCVIKHEAVLEHCGNPNCPEMMDHCLWVTISTTIRAMVEAIGHHETTLMVQSALRRHAK